MESVYFPIQPTRYVIRRKSMNRLSIALVLFLLGLGSAQAEMTVDINQGTFRPVPIAIPFFEGDRGSADAPGYAQQMSEVISNDLATSGLFRPIDRRSFLQGNGQYLMQPNFSDWRILNAEALVSGRVVDAGSGKITLEF